MRPLILFILLFAWVSACAPASKKHHKRYQKAHPTEQSAQKRPSKSAKSNATLKPSDHIVSGSMKTSLLPTLLNKKDQALMILIDAGKYRVGKAGKYRADKKYRVGNKYRDSKKYRADKKYRDSKKYRAGNKYRADKKYRAGKKKLSSRGTLSENQSPFTNLAAFYIDRTEITVTQFRKYKPAYDEKPFIGGKDCPNCPAMGINWIQASKYCRWAGKRLPQEEEWEAAARGASNFTYPWGEVFLPERSNILGEKDGHLFAAPVGSFLSGASASGVMDMTGNVWEWVDDKKSKRLQNGTRIVKGGGWASDKRQARISVRNRVNIKMNNPTFGFRCVKPLVKKR